MKIKREPKKIWVQHILEEGSRFHVKWYDSKGTHCNVKNCEINKPNINIKKRKN